MLLESQSGAILQAKELELVWNQTVKNYSTKFMLTIESRAIILSTNSIHYNAGIQILF